MQKRLLAAFLALCMMMTLTPFAFAADTTTQDTNNTQNIEETKTSAGGGNSQYNTVSNNNAETDFSSLSTYTSEDAITTQEALVTAVANAADGATITLGAGTFDLEGFKVTDGKSLTFIGAGKDNTILQYGKQASGGSDGGGGACYSFDGAGNIAFQNVVLQDKVATKDYYRGFVRAASMSFTNCKITNVAGYWGNGAVKFENCEFVTDVAESFNIKCYSGTSFEFDGCTFSSPYGFIDAYRQNTLAGTLDIKVNNCTFTGTGDSPASKPAVRLCDYTHSTEGGGWNLYFTGTNTATNIAEDSTTGTNLYGCRFYTQYTPLLGTVYIDGKAVWQKGEKVEEVAQIGSEKYTSLASAVAAATNGDTITLLKDTNRGFTVPAGKTIIFDLNGNKIECAGQAIQNNGTLTIRDSAKTGAIISTGFLAISVGNDSATTIDYANVSSVEGAILTSYATGATITIKDGVFNASDNAVIAGNGNKTDASGTSRVNANTITILGGTFNGGTTSEGYVACGIYAPWKDNVTVEGGTFNITGGAGIVARAGNVTIKGGEFNTTGNAIGKVGDSRVVVPCSALVFDSEAGYPALTADSRITVEGGKFKSQVDAINVVKTEADTSDRIVISNGYFSSDPSDYCVAEKTGIPSTEPGYAFTVGTYTAPDVKPATGEPAVNTDKLSGVDEEVTNTVTDVAESVIDKSDVLSAAAKQEATKIGDDQKTQAIEAIKKDTNVSTPEGTDIHVYAQTYLAIEPTKVDVDGTTVTSITLDIQPMSRVVASTVDLSNPGEELKTEGQGQNAVILPGSAKPINIQTMEISITLPTGFLDSGATKVYVQHKGYEYEANVSNNVATFTNPHGFSEFTISATSTAEAKIGDTSYMNFQDAVNAANDQDIIEIVKDGNYSATMSGSSRTITVKNGTNSSIDVTVNGEKKTLAQKDATADFTYTRPSSGSGGSGVTNYNVTVNAATNGTVTADKKTAAKGATVTITATPSTGYVVDKITVVDKNGKDVAVTAKDGKYTFVMPDSAVTVSASFKADGSVGQENPFVDVKSGEYYYDAVLWAVKNGVTQGVDSTHFGPMALTTRGQMVTFLWRYAGSPEPASQTCPFTDVKAGSYYEKAVLWAVEQGITKGTSETTFSPDAVVLRGQAVTFLARLAGVKDDAAATTHAFTDVTASDYFNNAVAWAAANNVTQGTSATTFSPNASCLRGQIVTFLYRAAQLK